MTVFAKAHSCGNSILINYSEIAPAHKSGVVVAGKGKRVEAFKPAVIGVASFLGFSDGNHGLVGAFKSKLKEYE